MLISFSFENFRSFLERNTLSMEAHSAHKNLMSSLIDAEGRVPGSEHLLAAAAIFGANAAGKSSLIEAMDYVRDAVVNSQSRWEATGSTRMQPHALMPKAPSFFEVQIIVDGVRYRYGFKGTRDRFEEEWLYAYPRKRERLLFHRMHQPEHPEEALVKFGGGLTGDERDHQSARRRTRRNSLFLSAAAQENQKECLAIFEWFYRSVNALTLPIDEDDYGMTNRICAINGEAKAAVLSMLRAADSNIREIVVKRKGEPRKVDEDWARTLPDETREFISENRDYTVSFKYSRNGVDFFVPLELQSEGTRRLYGLASSIICVLRFGEVAILDELEASMHPHICSQIVSLFQSRATNPKGAQIIFSTHNTNLLSDNILRRDQIWFVEKEDAASSLYSLLDFSPRQNENFELAYLKGKYGAIPTEGLALGFFSPSEKPR